MFRYQIKVFHIILTSIIYACITFPSIKLLCTKECVAVYQLEIIKDLQLLIIKQYQEVLFSTEWIIDYSYLNYVFWLIHMAFHNWNRFRDLTVTYLTLFLMFMIHEQLITLIRSMFLFFLVDLFVFYHDRLAHIMKDCLFI